jgi:hypothetical protein
MGEYKPLGSEKLNSDEKLKRILELTYYSRETKTNNTNKAELVKESNNGGVYGIVKEKDGYYVKRGINESSLDYIGGMFMKNKNRFSSYSEALKRLELLKGQEQIQEATKYVLKQKPKQEASMPAPSMDEPPADMPSDMPPAPSGDMGGDVPPPAPEADMPSEEMPAEPEAGGEMDSSKKSDYMAEIQKYAGKLGQEIRDQVEKMESDDIKYVLNMVISAVDLDKLDLEDLEEIGKKFERDEEEGMETMPEEPEMEPEAQPEEEPSSDSGEEEIGEYEDPMVKLEKFINSNSYEMSEGSDDDDIAHYAISENETMSEEDSVVELDMDEIKEQIAKSVNDTLSKYFK